MVHSLCEYSVTRVVAIIPTFLMRSDIYYNNIEVMIAIVGNRHEKVYYRIPYILWVTSHCFERLVTIRPMADRGTLNNEIQTSGNVVCYFRNK